MSAKIVVVATSERCPAVSALRSERLDFELVIAGDDFTYGETLQRYWRSGEDFINVEHDVVPWPGALDKLSSCDMYPWCGYDHPIGHSGLIKGSIGCIKIHGLWTKTHYLAAEYWNEITWNNLDAAIFQAMDRIPWHVHTPPVAHIDDMKVLA